MVGIAGFFAFLAVTLTPLIDEVLRFVEEFPKLAADLDGQLRRLGDYLRASPDTARDPPMDRQRDRRDRDRRERRRRDRPHFLLPLITGAGSLIGLVFGYLILPVWVAYILKDKVAIVATFDQALPASWRFDVWAIIRTVERIFGQWVRGQLILGFSVGVLTFIGLTILSQLVDPIFGRYAVLLSIIAGVLELVPIIGPILSAVPAVLLAATAGHRRRRSRRWLLYTLVQQLENNFLVPKIQGNAVELHPAAVIFAIIIGGSLAGLLGAILALPMTAAFRDVVRYLFRRLSPGEPAALARSLRNHRDGVRSDG